MLPKGTHLETILEEDRQQFPGCLALQELLLQNNQLTSIPQEIGKLGNLLTLDVSGNKLRVISKFIGSLGNLERLLLNGNPIRFITGRIATLNNLRDFQVENNQLRTVQKELGDLLESKEGKRLGDGKPLVPRLEVEKLPERKKQPVKKYESFDAKRTKAIYVLPKVRLTGNALTKQSAVSTKSQMKSARDKTFKQRKGRPESLS